MKPLTLGERRLLLGALALVLAVRVLTLGAYPLTDTTEARYGEIARKMATLGDWITPWFDWGVPFWGKPPLAFWLSAACMRVFGVSEFAARMPSFLVGLCLIGLAMHFARRQCGRDTALAAGLVLAATVVFFLCSGAVLTDMVLALAVTLGMVAFWRVAHDAEHASKVWGYVLFASFGLGLLSKGPVALVLTCAPIGIWLVLTGRWRDTLARLPWVGGLLCMVAIALPWYVTAESRTPGFLEYFLIGENFRRFTDPGWAGDLYGSVHARPHGYIWLLWLAAALPWSGIAVAASLRTAVPALRAGHVAGSPILPPWRMYLALFALTPAVFFSFAGSVLATYVVPGMPALAVLVAEWWMARDRVRRAAWLVAAALPLPLAFAAAIPVFNHSIAPERSQQALLSALPAGAPVVYFPQRPFSGLFYTQGRARVAVDAEALARRLHEAPDSYVVTPEGATLPAGLRERYAALRETGRKNKSVLWRPRDRVAGR